MQTKAFQKFCPSCKLANDANALVCQHCGTQLLAHIPETPSPQKETAPSGDYKSPPKGLAFFVLNKGLPFALRMENEFVIGRAEGSPPEPMLDLTDQDGFAFGVSRRHAMIRVDGDKYTVADLNSSNGTWLNGQLLVPTQPYDLPSGSVLQLGRLKLVASYSSPTNGTK